MVYTTCSVKELLDKIYSDYDIQELSNKHRIIENIYEGLELLQAIGITSPKIVELDIEDYKACIPKDTIEIMNVYAYQSIVNQCFKIEAKIKNAKLLKKANYAVEKLNKDEYNIIPDYLIFGIKEGKAIVRYQHYPLDEDGLPHIPNDPYVHQYLSKYVWYKMMMIKMHQGKIKPDIYLMIKQEMELARTRAKTSINFPNLDEMESYIKFSRQMIPTTNSRNIFFSAHNRDQLHKQRFV